MSSAFKGTVCCVVFEWFLDRSVTHRHSQIRLHVIVNVRVARINDADHGDADSADDTHSAMMMMMIALGPPEH